MLLLRYIYAFCYAGDAISAAMLYDDTMLFTPLAMLIDITLDYTRAIAFAAKMFTLSRYDARASRISAFHMARSALYYVYYYAAYAALLICFFASAFRYVYAMP